ncbi:unnamed protein product [Spirodela intermedia]|uniref:Uncharacterized protein n=1 Tax=Spirodela intermedia TaxID=51605 RepID=A0ABN7EBC7_SPIIN|nr:unnamed protein product [Spirodela intermedia]
MLSVDGRSWSRVAVAAVVRRGMVGRAWNWAR